MSLRRSVENTPVRQLRSDCRAGVNRDTGHALNWRYCLSRGRLRREIAAFSQRTDPHPDDVGSLDAAHSDSPGELIGHRNDAECQVPKKKTSVGSDEL